MRSCDSKTRAPQERRGGIGRRTLPRAAEETRRRGRKARVRTNDPDALPPMSASFGRVSQVSCPRQRELAGSLRRGPPQLPTAPLSRHDWHQACAPSSKEDCAMARAHGKKQTQTKTAPPTRTQSRGRASRRPSTPGRTRRALGERTGTPPAASRRSSVAEKPGISNHPLTEEVERQRQLPPRGMQRKTTPRGDEVKKPTEPAPVRRRGRAQDLEIPADE